MKGYEVYHYVLSHDDCSIRVYRSFTTIFHKIDAINISCTLPCYAGIMLNAFNNPLCSKLCWKIGGSLQ